MLRTLLLACLLATTVAFMSTHGSTRRRSVLSMSSSQEQTFIMVRLPSSLLPPLPLAHDSYFPRVCSQVKPDGVERGLVGRIMCRFEDKGLSLVAAKFCHAEEATLEQHYGHLASKPFFPSLVNYMTSAPVAPYSSFPVPCNLRVTVHPLLIWSLPCELRKVFQMVWKGRGAVEAGRAILGETDPLASSPGTVRGDFGLDIGKNLCHGSDSVEAAKKEISMWFKDQELVQWSPKLASLVVEDDDAEECRLYDPASGGCLVEDSGDEKVDRKKVLSALEELLALEKESAF